MILLSNHSGCGFYEDNGEDCCKPTGRVPVNNCLSNGKSSCSAKEFGGIPALDGSGSSNVCQGNEAWGKGASDLMAEINWPCSCFPSKWSPCETKNNHRVCRVDDMLWDGVANSESYDDHVCDECRTCMMNQCSGLDVTVDFSDPLTAQQTISDWMGEKTGCQGSELCIDKCSYTG